MSCGVGCRCSSDPVLLWLWHRPAATAPNSAPSLGTSICRRSGPRKGRKTQNQKKRQKKNHMKQKFPLWYSRLGIWHCLCGSAGSIPSLVQWVKDPMLPQIWLGCSSSLDWIPGPEISTCHGCSQKKKERKKSHETWFLTMQ